MSIGLVLTIVFVVLQWMDVINWEWWQIVLPLAIEASLALIAFLIFGGAIFKFGRN